MGSIQEAKQKIFDAIQKYETEAFGLNYFLADNPEISGEEFRACEKICALLESHGIPTERGVAGRPTAFRGVVKRDENSPIRIAILAEYDALPGIGHGCGHCASGSISVLTALALHACADELEGSIDIIGTPDEEGTGAKIDMSDQGLFDGYDFAVMMHIHSKNKVHTKFLALSSFEYSFRGKPAHAAGSPWEGKNAMNGATLMIHAFDMARQHIKPSARIHGIITNGGSANNVIPDFSTALYSARYPEKDYLKHVVDLMHDCAKGAAIATQTEVEIKEIGRTLDNMKQNPAGQALLQETFEEVGLRVVIESDENIGSSDIGNVSHRCAAFHPYISAADEGEFFPLHTKELAARMKDKKIEKVIENGAKILSLMIARAILEPETMEAIRRDFKDNG